MCERTEAISGEEGPFHRVARPPMAEIRKVYEQFKHLDRLLSDPGWLNLDDKIHSCCHDLWMAVKAAVKEMGDA